MSAARWPFVRSVKGDIMAGATVMVVALGVVAMGNIHHGLARLLRSELTRRGLAIGDLVANAGEGMLLTGDEFALHSLLRGTVERNPDVSYAYVKNASGRVAAHSFPGGFPRGLAEAHEPASERGMRLIDTPEEGRIQDVSVLLMGGRLGSVHIGMSEGRVRARIVRLVAGWGLAAAALLAGGLCAAQWLTARFSSRIERLIRATEEVGQGNLDAAATDGGSDEIGRLGSAFERMAQDLKRSQAALLRAGQLAAVGELASGVAHEINNPLNTMGVCCQSLLGRSRSPGLLAQEDFADFPEYLSTIHEEIFRCKKITASLLDFARRREPALDRVQLNDVVHAALTLAELRPNRSRTPFALSLAEGLPAVRADRDQLRQVLVNLLINALDHLPEGGSVEVSSARDRGDVLIRVRDDGPGIPPENLARIFEPFFTTKKPGSGTGLGLAICRRIVEAHRGNITVVSPPGGGATFTVALPAVGGADA